MSSHPPQRSRTALWCAVAVTIAASFGQAQQAPAPCTVSGRVTSGATPLPGVSLVVTTGAAVAAATSTAADGTYRLALPAGTYQVKAELTGFVNVDRAMTLTGDPCGAQVRIFNWHCSRARRDRPPLQLRRQGAAGSKR